MDLPWLECGRNLKASDSPSIHTFALSLWQPEGPLGSDHTTEVRGWDFMCLSSRHGKEGVWLECRENIGARGGEEPGEGASRYKARFQDTLLVKISLSRCTGKSHLFSGTNKIDIQNCEKPNDANDNYNNFHVWWLHQSLSKHFGLGEFEVNFPSVKTKTQHFGLPFISPSLLLKPGKGLCISQSIKLWFNITFKKRGLNNWKSE